MASLLGSVFTILLVTALGWALMRFNVVKQAQWDGFEHVSWQVFFPAVIIHSLITADLANVPALRFGLAFLIPVVAVGGALLLARPAIKRAFGINDSTFSSIMQGSTRWNTFMAVSLAGILHGGHGLTLTAVGIVAIIPLMNFWTVWMLRWLGEGQSKGAISPATFLKNPFIWSSLIGIALNMTGIKFPAPIMSAIDMCGKAALATGLLLVGSGLRLEYLSRPTMPMVLATAVKLFAVPLLAALCAWLFGLGAIEMSVLLICASMPCAGAAYIMARQMGGDAPLMAAIVTAETVVCAVTVPLFQWLFVPL